MRYYFLALGALMVVCMGCAGIDGGSSVLKTNEHINPPAGMLQRPGPMVDGPGPGVLGILAQQTAASAAAGAAYCPPGGAAGYAGGYAGGYGVVETTQVKFVGQPGMVIGWKVGDGFAEDQLVVTGRYDFPQNAVYQLKFSTIPEFPSLQLYPTLEVRASHPTTRAYLEHNSVPVEITDEDLDHVLSNNMVTKVIYLPDPEFQARAIAGVETLVSTKLDPGVDPVQQAEKMGTIMLVLRFGNKDLEMRPLTQVGPDGVMQQVSHTVYSGQDGEFVPPTPIALIPGDVIGVPPAIIAAGGGVPGQAPHPIAGMGPTPPWGMPITGTPIGLPGPPHLPYGGPAGLKSHTMRNLSDNFIPEPTDHLLIDVDHDPGYNIPTPVRHIQYSEDHPVHAPGQVAHPQSKAAQIYGF